MEDLSAPSSSPAQRIFLAWGTKVESLGVLLVGEGVSLLIPVPHLSFFFLLSFTCSLGSMNLVSVLV